MAAPTALGESALAELARGARVEAREHRLLIELGPRVRLQLEPGTILVLGPVEERRELDVELATGRLMGATGPAHVPASLVVRTAHAKATVLGTTFVVDALDAGSCFCVGAGHVRVRSTRTAEAQGRGAWDLTDGSSLFVFSDGRVSRASIDEGGGHLGAAEHAAEHARELREFVRRRDY